MKSAITRTLALIALGASLTGFAAAEECKSNNVTPTVAKQQDGGATAEEGKKTHKAKKDQNRSEQEQELDRVLMGIFG